MKIHIKCCEWIIYYVSVRSVRPSAGFISRMSCIINDRMDLRHYFFTYANEVKIRRSSRALQLRLRSFTNSGVSLKSHKLHTAFYSERCRPIARFGSKGLPQLSAVSCFDERLFQTIKFWRKQFGLFSFQSKPMSNPREVSRTYGISYLQASHSVYTYAIRRFGCSCARSLPDT